MGLWGQCPYVRTGYFEGCGGGGSLGWSLDDVYIHQVPSKIFRILKPVQNMSQQAFS